MSGLGERLAEVRARIENAAERSGRSAADVLLVAVTKTFPASVVREAIAAGITDVGENRAQELVAKAQLIGDAVGWHFIGSLQKNKVRHVVGLARLIHSLDDLALAEAIGRRATAAGIEQEVLVEVNLSGESSKSGVALAEAVALAKQAEEVEGVAVRGLMAIPAFPEQPEDSRAAYRTMAEAGRELQATLPAASELSIGMTRDFEVAVEEGATIVRVGEALFGPRPKP